jgi:hypothetical protein
MQLSKNTVIKNYKSPIRLICKLKLKNWVHLHSHLHPEIIIIWTIMKY